MKSTTVQTYLFAKDTWTKAKAKAWLVRHRKVSTVTAEGAHADYWHARQIDPVFFELRSMRTISLDPGLGLKAVVGHLRASNHTRAR